MFARWRNLPSLTALRAFDATARHGGFTGAGRVLNVTHVAVAQQVRALEAELGVPLVTRAGRAVSLTPAGLRLAQALNAGFETMAAGLDDLRRSEARRPLRVATTTFIAEMRILPRLPEFWALHPGVDVAMSPSEVVVDLARDGFDLAVRVLPEDGGDAARDEIRPLARTPLIAVCAPSLHPDGVAPGDLPWLISRDDPRDHDTLRLAGLDPAALKLVELGSPHLAMSAARRGLGCMLAAEIICRDDLAQGSLVRVPVGPLPMLTYACVLPKGPRPASVDRFADWLAAIFGADA